MCLSLPKKPYEEYFLKQREYLTICEQIKKNGFVCDKSFKMIPSSLSLAYEDTPQDPHIYMFGALIIIMEHYLVKFVKRGGLVTW